MAGAYDRDIVIPTATAPSAPDTYIDPIQKKTQLGIIQKEYLAKRSETRVILEGQKTTIQDLAKRANEIKDPKEKAEFLQGVKNGLANVKLGLELQAIVDANDNANAGASKEAQDLLKSDAIFVAQGTSGISNTGKYYLNGVEVSKEDYANGVDRRGGGDTPVGGGSGVDNKPVTNSGAGGSSITKESRDAFAILDTAFKQFGLEALAGKIKDFMLLGLTSNEAIIELRKTSEYQTRFAGNAARLKSGLNALSEGEYLALEDSYSETLRAYGQQAFFGVDRNARQAKIAEIIGADISAVEFKDRIATVVSRVESADPVIKATLRDFYKISDTDLVGYFLNPKENLPKLQEKVTAAEIGSAALNQGLDTSVASAEALAKAGVDLATARRGYSAIADVLPTASKLSQIYDETGMKYTQATAEAETFEGLASAQRKRLALAERELAEFSGRSGVGKTSLTQKSTGLI
jgi:hypothetical protein